MKEYKLINGQVNKFDFKEIIQRINDNQVFITPTDTIYGLSARADSVDSQKRISQMKERGDKPFILLVSSILMIKKYCCLSNLQERYFKENILNSDKATTIILQARENNNLVIDNENNTLALRLPKCPFLIKIIEEINIPLISTSLNISGAEIVNDLEIIKSGYFRKDQPGFLINDGINTLNKSSRLVDLRNVDNIKIIRD